VAKSFGVSKPWIQSCEKAEFRSIGPFRGGRSGGCKPVVIDFTQNNLLILSAAVVWCFGVQGGSNCAAVFG